MRIADIVLVRRLEQGVVATHPFVIGELALGSLRNRNQVIANLSLLPNLSPVPDEQVRQVIEARGLHGVGIGYVDAHLLAALLDNPGNALWTRERRLAEVARRSGVPLSLD